MLATDSRQKIARLGDWLPRFEPLQNLFVRLGPKPVIPFEHGSSPKPSQIEEDPINDLEN